jgi:hypothetical protein
MECEEEALTNRVHPLSAHAMREVMLPAERVRKLSPQMNVKLVGDLEIFGRHADGITL